MTTNDFLSELEGYYGNKLPEKARLYTENYLRKYDTSNLKDLLMIVLMYHPLQFHTPGMAVIEKAHTEYCKERDSLKKDNRISATRPIDDDPIISEEEREEVQKMMKEEGGILGIIANRRVAE